MDYDASLHRPAKLKGVIEDLQPLVKGKSVEVVLGPTMPLDHFMSESSLAANKQFQLLRCDDFRFPFPKKTDELRDIESIVMSELPIMDLSTYHP